MVKKISRGLFFLLVNLGCIISTPVFATFLYEDSYILGGELDYLHAGFKDAPLPIPLVTTSNAADGGVLGRPSTQVLFGQDSYSSGHHNGFSLTVGHRLGCDSNSAIEVSGFGFWHKGVTNFSQETTDGRQILAIPFNNVTPGGGSGGVGAGSLGAGAVAGPNSFLLSGSITQFPGSIAVTSSAQFWGGEVNGLTEICHDNCWGLNLLYGLRYIDLHENLNITAIQYITGTVNAQVNNAVFSDTFNTRNQFYGAQVGIRGEWRKNCFFINANAKVGLGLNRQTLKIKGTFADPGPIFLVDFAAGNTGGIFAQGTNIGVHHRNKLSFVPELKLQLGYEFTENFRFAVGYFATFICNVIRPGKQIDPNINLSQFGLPSSRLNGAPNPALKFRKSSFWAQGISLGIQMRY